jgi:4a-hydroxytetrahydrobiopterin dehydratase
MKKLSEEEIARRLEGLEGWCRDADCIEKRYVFRSFATAMLFVNAVAYIAESLDHHPDILIHYNEVTLRNWTHAMGALTERDFTLAERIDRISGS